MPTDKAVCNPNAKLSQDEPAYKIWSLALAVLEKF